MYSVGELIAFNRKKQRMSQPELAAILSKQGFPLTHKAISKWETNAAEPSVTVFLAVCKILKIEDIYGAYFGFNPSNPLSGLNEEGREKALDYIRLLHASGFYVQAAGQILPFRRQIDVYENAVSAGTGNLLFDGVKETYTVTDAALIPEDASFGVLIRGNSMEPEFQDGQIAWVLKQDYVSDGEIGIFALTGESYIKKLQDNQDGLYLVSLNKTYAPIPVGENDRLDTFGIVIGKCDLSTLKGTANSL